MGRDVTDGILRTLVRYGSKLMLPVAVSWKVEDITPCIIAACNQSYIKSVDDYCASVISIEPLLSELTGRQASMT